jgi:uncharacterized protein
MMPASIPASILNQMFAPLGIPRDSDFKLDALGPTVLGLFGREALKEDGNAASVWTGNGGISLAQNLGSEAEVDRLMTHAANIGATILKPAQRAFWGGYHGYFADPDGHIWEIAHNPFFNLDEAGTVILP